MSSHTNDSRFTARKIISLVALIVISVTMLYPLLWMIGTSVKTNDPVMIAREGSASSIFPSDDNILANLFPKVWHWENYPRVFQKVDFARYFLNSIGVALVVTAGQLVTCSMAAYAFSRLKFPGRDRIFFLYLGTLMVPATVTLIPTFIFLSKLGWIDSYFALAVPPMFSAYGTFLLRQFFMGIPHELEEAARIDGCNSFWIYWKVVLPLSLPALATLAIFAFLGNWQSFLYPLVMVNSDSLKTLPLGLLNFVDLNSADWSLLMAASVMTIIPVIVIFLFCQRFFVSGVRLGGVKG